MGLARTTSLPLARSVKAPKERRLMTTTTETETTIVWTSRLEGSSHKRDFIDSFPPWLDDRPLDGPEALGARPVGDTKPGASPAAAEMGQPASQPAGRVYTVWMRPVRTDGWIDPPASTNGGRADCEQLGDLARAPQACCDAAPLQIGAKPKARLPIGGSSGVARSQQGHATGRGKQTVRLPM